MKRCPVFTCQLSEGCKLFGVALLDHVIIGNAPEDGFHSMQAHGTLPY